MWFPKSSALLIPFPENDIYAIFPTEDEGNDSAEPIGTRAISIDELIVGETISESLKSLPIGNTSNELFCKNVLSFWNASDVAIPDEIVNPLVNAKLELVGNEASEVIPDDKVTLCLKAIVAVPKDSSDGIDVAPILWFVACALKSSALIS